MEKYEEEFLKYLEEQVVVCNVEEKELLTQERKDEANLCKIKANIYGIFKVLFETSQKQATKADERNEQITSIFLEKAQNVPENWKDSYEKAKEHNDVEKILIEETKLNVVHEILSRFDSIRKGE